MVPLSGHVARATDVVRRIVDPAEPVVFPLAHLADGGRRVLREHRFEHLALVGTPPADEIGYGFATLIAIVGRPRHVDLVDLEFEKVASQSLLRYVLRTAPFAAAQFVGSAVAVGAQGAAISLARRAPPRRTRAPDLTRLLYLRAAVGSTSGVGGSVTHSHEVIRALVAEGIAVDAFTTDARIASTAAREPEPPCAWHVVRTPRATKAVPASAAAGGDAALVRAALPAARTADAIYQRHARFSLAGLLLARLSGRPLILEYNGSEVYFGRYWNPTALRRRLAACEDAVLEAADRIIVVSEVDRRSLVQRGIDAERIVLNPNGVAAEQFANGGGSDVRVRHGLAAADLVIGFVGTFGSWHGAPVLAQAFTDAAASLPQARLLLVGDGPELKAARSIVRNAGLEGRTIATGQVPPSDVPRLLDACDILVSPHVALQGNVEFFGSPTKLFEYMAAGKAIIASRLGQISEVLEHQVTGLLVKPGDPDELAHALRMLAEAPERRRELGKNARRQAIERHSWRENARRIADAYRQLAAGETV
jgi:glycosyltransferase involved in cell wall biosynthesis